MLHAIKYTFWLIGQVLIAGWVLTKDTLTGSKNLDPCVVRYPLRVTKDWQITVFAASITATPGTMSITLEEDDSTESSGQRYLLVHAVAGADPRSVLADLAHMEETLAPHVKGLHPDFAAVLDQATWEYPSPKPVFKEDN